MIGYKIWRDHRDITDPTQAEATGWKRETMRQCWAFLDQTSRSFSMVIKELDGELARVVSTHCGRRILTHRSVFSTSSSAPLTLLRTI